MKNTTINFVENGINYHAGTGFAFAEKDGETIWRALDVFKTNPPTKELVLMLDKLCDKVSKDDDVDED